MLSKTQKICNTANNSIPVIKRINFKRIGIIGGYNTKRIAPRLIVGKIYSCCYLFGLFYFF